MAELIALTVDGRPASVPAGSTILDAARAAGVRIPTLCDHRHLSPYGGCRLCVVEVEGSDRLFASCVTPAAAGMKVLTGTDRVKAARQSVLELILAYHPLECPVCPQSGGCKLQDAAFEHGLSSGRFGHVAVPRGVDRVSPLIENNQDRCILCGRCVRVCDEVQGEGHLSFSGRGFPTVVSTAFRHKWECEFCGQCFQACPVGALYSRPFAHTAPLWDLAEVRTACPFCGVGCGLSARARNGRVHLVLGAEDGFLCSKGRFGYEALSHPGRLTRPLVRQGGGLAPVSWDEAVARAAAGVREALAAAGPGAVGGIASPLATNEDAWVFGRLLRAVVGSPHLDTSSAWQFAPAAQALGEAFGLPASTLTLASLSSSDLILAVEANLTEDSHVAGLAVLRRARREGARLVVAHGRRTKISRFAHQWLRPRPGQAASLLHAMAAAILEEGLEDREFCKRRVTHLPALRESLAPWSPEKVAPAVGVPAEAIREAARAFAGARSAAILLGPGSGSPFTGGEAAAAAANLALVTGQVGRDGAGILLLPEFANSQGTLDMGLSPRFLPGWQDARDPGARGWFGEVWGALLPAGPGMGAAEMMAAAADGRLKALLLMGEDPLRSFPDRGLVERALARVPFLAVSGSFLSGAAARAHVVFPSAMGMEKEGTVTAGDRRVQRARAAAAPPGEAWPDWMIFSALASALGHPRAPRSAAEVTAEIAAAVPAYSGTDPSRSGREAVPWPSPRAGDPGTEVLHRERFFSGLGRVRPAPAPKGHPEPVEGRPFLLVTGTVQHHLGDLLTRAANLSRLTPEPVAELHPDDAARLEVASGDPVRIESGTGSVTVRAAVTDRPLPGTVFLPVHFAEAPWGALVDGESAARCAPVPVSVTPALPRGGRG